MSAKDDCTSEEWGQIGPERIAPFMPTGTFLRAQRRDTAVGLDIAMFGVPFDMGTFEAQGARYGPAQIRNRSINVRQINGATGFDPFEACKLADIGDAPISVFDAEESLKLIEDYSRKIHEAGVATLAVGGDHTNSLSVFRGVVDADRPVSVVHFDAHSDTADEYFGNKYHYASVFRRTVEEGLEDPKRHITIGIRGTTDPIEFSGLQWARDQGFTILTDDDCAEMGPKAIAHECHAVVGDGPVYVTIDVDGIDPADMPGTGSPEPGGLRMREAMIVLRGLRGLNIIGADITEVSPSLDPSGMTALNAAHLIFELVCLLAEHRAGRR